MSSAERKHGWTQEHTEALRAYVLENDHQRSLTGGIIKECCAIFSNMDVNYLNGKLRTLRTKLSKETRSEGPSILLRSHTRANDQTNLEQSTSKKARASGKPSTTPDPDHAAGFALHKLIEYVDSNGKDIIMVVLSHVAHCSMKYKVSENGTELIVTVKDKFVSAAPYIDTKIKTAAEVLEDPESKALSSIFNQPQGNMTYSIPLGKAVATNPIKRPVKDPSGNTARTIILLTLRKDDNDADSMESL